jgi:hypothetical protein
MYGIEIAFFSKIPTDLYQSLWVKLCLNTYTSACIHKCLNGWEQFTFILKANNQGK